MTSRSSASKIRHLRSIAACAPIAAAIAFAASPAAAQQANCPPGSWFCGDTQQKPAAPAGQPVAPATAPPPAAPPPAAKGLEPLPPASAPAPTPAPAPTVIYQPSPPVVVYQPPPPVYVREAPPPYYYTPREPGPRKREWGLNLRLEGAMMGHNSSSTSGMGGLGLGVRYKPVPAFGVEGGVDFFGGRDYNDNHRSETAFTLNAMVFVNPRSKAQIYFLAGFGWSNAHIDDTTSYLASSANYQYFGGQVGGGLEFRVSKHFALNVDVRGFIRGRTDDSAQYRPEFVDASGRTTNTSGGGLVTGGMTFYF